MRKTTNHIILIVIYFAFLFNLERIQIDGHSILPLQIFVYLLAIILFLSIILVKSLAKQLIAVLFLETTILYLICKFLFFRQATTFSREGLLTSFIELLLLLILVDFSRQLSRSLVGLQELIENALLPKANHKVFALDNAEPLIEDEFIRGRRYNYPISTMVVLPETNPVKWPTTPELDLIIQDIVKTIRQKYLLETMSRVISQQVRHNDLIVELDKLGCFYLILPEVNHENSAIVADRISRSLYDKIGVAIACSTASFPEDGLTFSAILEKARNKNTDYEVLSLPDTEE